MHGHDIARSTCFETHALFSPRSLVSSSAPRERQSARLEFEGGVGLGLRASPAEEGTGMARGDPITLKH